MTDEPAGTARRPGPQDRILRWSLDRARRTGALRRWRPPWRRKALVAAQATVGMLLIAGFLTPAPLAFVLLFGMLVPFVFLTSQLNLASGMLTELSPRSLDERELNEQMHARNVSHRLVTWTLLVAVLGLALVSGGGLREGWFEVTPGAFLAFLLLLFFVHTGLPAAYLAWTRSEESYDEEDEASGPETG